MAAVVVVGAGGLGGPIALAVAAAGRPVVVVDDDVVELSNLHRQAQFTMADLGRPKAEVLARRASAGARAVVARFPDLPADLGPVAAIVDGSDDPPTKFAVAASLGYLDLGGGRRLAILRVSAGGVWLTKQFTWIFYFFGAYLIYSGLGLLKGEDDEEDGAENSFAVRTLRRFVRVVDGDHGGKFMVRDSHGRRALTILAVTVVVVELTDIVFALDSIPAVLAVSQESFVIITSNIMAILGLRSLYFMLAGAMAQFHYLKYALAGLLVFIGAKMIAHDHLHVPNLVSLAIIAGFIGTGVVASIIANRRRAPAAGGDDAGAGGTPA